jgi:hypothetical protein
MLRSTLVAFWLAVLAFPASADITGVVTDYDSGEPLADVIVSIRARPDIPTVLTGDDGTFVLPLTLDPMQPIEIATAIPYSDTAEHNYLVGAQQAYNGMNVPILMFRSPAADTSNYTPPSSRTCQTCHGNYHSQWSSSRHAGSAVNEWVLDLYSGGGTPGGSNGYVFRDTHAEDNTGFCAVCHAPMEDIFTPGEVFLDEVGTDAGLDGVSCLGCHQIAHVDADNINALGHLGKTDYRFPEPNSPVPTFMYVWGPLADVSNNPMQAHYSPLHSDPLLCASCHQYTNPTTGAPGQNTYQEWLASPYAQAGPGRRTCQNCHMPKETSPGQIGMTGPTRPASQRTTHRFIGATPQRLVENIDLRIGAVQEKGYLVVTTEVENSCGHNFPTGISIRNALLLIDARIDGVELAQSAGPVLPFWASDDVPGIQPGDHAGRPGKGYAKVLQGRINGEGPVQQPVLFIDAETVLSDTGIPSGSTDIVEFRFAIPPGLAKGTMATIDAELLYRRAWRALAVAKGWTQTPGGMPVEIPVQDRQLEIELQPVSDVIFASDFETVLP